MVSLFQKALNFLQHPLKKAGHIPAAIAHNSTFQHVLLILPLLPRDFSSAFYRTD